MKIIFFAHPTFISHQSMPRFAKMLADGMKESGHIVEIWAPKPKFFSFPVPGSLKKWMSYLDQYLVFPQQVKKRLKKLDQDTLFVFTDHALGPWVPLVSNRPHVVHCHDFLAQLSALDEIPENKTSSTGKIYQSYIRKGYQQGKAFISVSKKTKNDLDSFLDFTPDVSEVVYNGVNTSFKPTSIVDARALLKTTFNIETSSGYILHVGGNQWYKNRSGIIEIYDQWRKSSTAKLPLLLLGETPSDELKERREQSLYKEDIHFLTGVDDATVRAGYVGATVFLFPSLAEGFGWPIAEAMASGTLVITTDEAPMTEVAGDAAFLIDRMPNNKTAIAQWSKGSAVVLEQIVQLSDEDRAEWIAKGLNNVKRFDLKRALNQIEEIYKKVLKDN